MHNLLSRLLNKRGIHDPNQLDKEEQELFEQWQKVLNTEELTLEDVKKFCKGQLGIIEAKWADYDKDNSKKAELIPYWTVYSILLKTIDAPKAAREALEQQLNQLL